MPLMFEKVIIAAAALLPVPALAAPADSHSHDHGPGMTVEKAGMPGGTCTSMEGMMGNVKPGQKQMMPMTGDMAMRGNAQSGHMSAEMQPMPCGDSGAGSSSKVTPDHDHQANPPK